MNETGDGYSGKVVILTADIDMGTVADWEPIGQTNGNGSKTFFRGTFDGAGHTISNLTVKAEGEYDKGGSYAAGLFGFIDAGDAHIRNLTVENATIAGHHWTAVIAGYMTGTISNCHVVNSNVTCTHANNDACGDKAGTVTGQVNSGVVKYCTATGCTVKAGRDAGQIVGASIPANVQECSATNVTVTAIDGCTGKNIRNEVVGREL